MTGLSPTASVAHAAATRAEDRRRQQVNAILNDCRARCDAAAITLRTDGDRARFAEAALEEVQWAALALGEEGIR